MLMRLKLAIWLVSMLDPPLPLIRLPITEGTLVWKTWARPSRVRYANTPPSVSTATAATATMSGVVIHPGRMR